ncbi:uncharacterized protein AMSG_11699 [Thecamonas trahens ATCC 50062]|uniref:Uncharacterized protein n=1 Tax=Thecamonas trahens ATCC 50062 TaxID=461836 RepID=A0A0L0DVD1_THETB|nr:hypothetical protein AMSG_11699 [Thecamonas trahens ATCC 50062]KNC56264.1 hypothetical protein AMSG_11699 [Thecamonas trahens ATCC 50062]|eukprot:XP_013760992.1 hypothetical protein AMSG_11699 [Thecamonas trahens ATCC 50062]
MPCSRQLLAHATPMRPLPSPPSWSFPTSTAPSAVSTFCSQRRSSSTWQANLNRLTTDRTCFRCVSSVPSARCPRPSHLSHLSPNTNSRMSGKKGGNIFDRLTDPSGYTGAHKERFDASGRGKGRAGRMDLVENDGYVTGARIGSRGSARGGSPRGGSRGRRRPAGTSPSSGAAPPASSTRGRSPRGRGSRGSPSGRGRGSPSGRGRGSRPSPSGRSGGRSKAADITARLTDPSTYSATHKHRFKSDGTGAGKAGRVDVVENDGYVSSYKKQKSDGKVSKRVGGKAADITARLTDPSTYSATHKHRFKADGTGAGKAGRVDVVENDGYVGAYREKRRGGKAPSKRVGSKASSVVDRLTDTSGYTGAHKSRFTPDGKGRGKAGRVDVVENTGYTASFDKSRSRGRGSRR